MTAVEDRNIEIDIYVLDGLKLFNEGAESIYSMLVWVNISIMECDPCKFKFFYVTAKEVHSIV